MPVPARKAVVLALFAAWLIALPMHVVTTHWQGAETGMGIAVIGLMGPLIGQFGWFANPLLLIELRRAWPSAEDRRPAPDLVLSILLALLAVNSLFWDDIPTDAGSDPITAYGPGYYLWLASVTGTAILAFTLSRNRTRTS